MELPSGCLEDKVLDVRYEDALSKDHYHEKSVRGDITITFDDTSINLEAYTTFDKNSLNKSAYYIMRIHVGKLHRKNPYLNLGKTVQINFVDQVKMDLGDHLITNFYLTSEYDLNTKLIPESFCIKIIQIDKLKELGYNETEVIKWLKQKIKKKEPKLLREMRN